ncbi:LysR family transcriptional regulator [Dyella sp.]|uniref:LysR family transcriptional regulator n=1 Tax=Dyella sp. TaxID=1869338 RepID=UPI002D765399|nr:LysR family transcriptional regulator [Dyella sp.]HET6431305.1 LysR family transcriptional regulator [Dyella sp.]
MDHAFRRIDLNLFRVLAAIDTHGGISAAARALHLTQPAVTHALNRLRTLFDDPLFVRQGNRVVATDRTRGVMADVQLHLKGLHAAVRQQSSFDPATLEMTFAVGFRDVLESIAFPALMRRLAGQAPGVRIVSRRVATAELERELVAGSLDMVVDRRQRVSARIGSEHLLDESLVVAMRAQHPLARAPLRRADYLGARHVAVSSLGEPVALDVLLNQDGRDRDVGLICQHYFAACQIAADTDLLLTLPASYAASLTPLLPLAVRPLPLALKPIPILAYWHASRQSEQAHAWLRGQVMEAIRDAPAFRTAPPRRRRAAAAVA